MLSGLNYSKCWIISFVQEKLSLNYTLWVKYKLDLLILFWMLVPEIIDVPNYWWHVALLAKIVTPRASMCRMRQAIRKDRPFYCFTRLTQGGSEVGIVSPEIDNLAREQKDLCLLTEKQKLTQGQIQQGERWEVVEEFALFFVAEVDGVRPLGRWVMFENAGRKSEGANSILLFGFASFISIWQPGTRVGKTMKRLEMNQDNLGVPDFFSAPMWPWHILPPA